MLASHLPCIPEYLSNSSGAAEDVFDNSKEGKMLDPCWFNRQYIIDENNCIPIKDPPPVFLIASKNIKCRYSDTIKCTILPWLGILS